MISLQPAVCLLLVSNSHSLGLQGLKEQRAREGKKQVVIMVAVMGVVTVVIVVIMVVVMVVIGVIIVMVKVMVMVVVMVVIIVVIMAPGDRDDYDWGRAR